MLSRSRTRTRFAGLLLAGISVAGCIFSGEDNSTPSGIHFHVYIPALGLDSLEVRVEVNSWEYGDTARFLVPPVYADNPIPISSGPNFHHFSVTGQDGEAIGYFQDSLQTGWQKSGRISIVAKALPAVLSYYVKFQYPDTIKTVHPYMNAFGGYLQGNLMFVVPAPGETLEEIWRTPMDLTAAFHTGAQVPFFGDPLPEARFRSPYELMFSTAALGGEVLAASESGGQAFRFVTLNPQDTIAAANIGAMTDDFKIILSDITGSFQAISHPVTVILGINTRGGLEGMHAFSILEARNREVFAMVLAHEMLHSWIGLRTGELDDPWMKEGITNYLGFLIARRNNLIPQVYLDTNLLMDLAENPDVNTYSLSDEYLRGNLFRQDAVMYQLAYVKGAQVAMMMDYRIRAASSSTTTLDRVIGALSREFDGKAFSRRQFLDFVFSRSGADMADLFNAYVDTPGSIPVDALNNSFNGLKRLGAFDVRTFSAAHDVLYRQLYGDGPSTGSSPSVGAGPISSPPIFY